MTRPKYRVSIALEVERGGEFVEVRLDAEGTPGRPAGRYSPAEGAEVVITAAAIDGVPITDHAVWYAFLDTFEERAYEALDEAIDEAHRAALDAALNGREES